MLAAQTTARRCLVALASIFALACSPLLAPDAAFAARKAPAPKYQAAGDASICYAIGNFLTMAGECGTSSYADEIDGKVGLEEKVWPKDPNVAHSHGACAHGWVKRTYTPTASGSLPVRATVHVSSAVAEWTDSAPAELRRSSQFTQAHSFAFVSTQPPAPTRNPDGTTNIAACDVFENTDPGKHQGIVAISSRGSQTVSNKDYVLRWEVPSVTAGTPVDLYVGVVGILDFAESTGTMRQKVDAVVTKIGAG